jgi:predicted nucleotidyltransferase
VFADSSEKVKVRRVVAKKTLAFNNSDQNSYIVHMNSIILQNQNSLEKICRSLPVEMLYIFGSGVVGSLRNDSDLDFLVTFKSDLSAQDYADAYFMLHKKLTALFNRKIDLVTGQSLSNPYFTESINSSKKLIYDEKHQKISI